jgi:nucleotide-binding universal stress UspA family protein
MPYQKILVPLDGSYLAERVVQPALALAEAMGGSVTLLTVVTRKPGNDPDLMAKAIQSGSYEAGLYLRAVQKRFMPTLAPVETAVVTGKPENAIIAFARENAIELIIMSTHGRSGLTRWSFGRVADKVLRRSPCPTVILRSDKEIKPEKFRRILLPLDGSVLAERVLEAALLMAAHLAVELLLLRVVEHSAFYGFGHDEESMEREIQEAQVYLETVKARINLRHVPVSCHVLKGPATDVIVDFAETEKVDLIVLSSRGDSGFDAWMFGSVAEKVMKGAPCAILVIRQEPFIAAPPE